METRRVENTKPAVAEFFPRGAIAFFVAMMGAFSLIWLGMYALLVHRQTGL